MSNAVTSSLGIVAYLALFAAIGILFLFVNLLVGRFVRPRKPNAEKLDVYECGEPAIGTSYVQFDLRFYVVALLFIIFDVEVAFVFPWAAVFGKATHLADPRSGHQVIEEADGTLVLPPTATARAVYNELGIRDPRAPVEVPASLRGQVTGTAPSPARSEEIIRRGGKQLALVTIVDIGAFFAVLMVGFAYVWKRGDLNWVRAYSSQNTMDGERAGTVDQVDLDQALSASVS